MHPRDFLKGFAEDVDRDRLVEAVHREMLDYCQKNNVTLDEVGSDELWELADGFVTRGLSYEGLGQDKRWKVQESPPSSDFEPLFSEQEPYNHSCDGYAGRKRAGKREDCTLCGSGDDA